MSEEKGEISVEGVRELLVGLEAVVEDRALLNGLSKEEQKRFLQAAGDVFCPDVNQRRRQVKQRVKQRKAERIEKDEEVFAETGIRKLRAKTVFSTPNFYPPKGFEQKEVEDPDFRELVEPTHCYICKEDYTRVHPFYDQQCPTCAELNFR
ncbi:MAG: oxidoreductase, partial [Verrucomicrobiales bacterium]|nr:oxidoreductase [Verrucomicrobiales bacterium]